MSDIVILYQISNERPSPSSSTYNAFSMRTSSNGVSLSAVKQFSQGLFLRLNPLGANGYHWRVRMEDRSSQLGLSYSWWDVQDESARLPVKEATMADLRRMFPPPSAELPMAQEVTKAAKGAIKYVNKAMNVVAGSTGTIMPMEDTHQGPKTRIICFKLLDYSNVTKPMTRTPATKPSANQPRTSRPSAPLSTGAPRQQPQQTVAPARKPVTKSVPPPANLLHFGTALPGSLAHSESMPLSPTATLPNESRAEKLQREYAQKAATSQRVWDDIDQRWVEGPVKNGEASTSASLLQGSSSSHSLSASPHVLETTIKGISIDATNAFGKSDTVASAIHARVAQMEQSQQQAISELRLREQQKAAAEAEEEAVRVRLDPKLKAWSEEHGQKKQLRALLANLHTILWEDSGWKPISLADVLEDSKVKRLYHTASRVVHPDKTGHLDAEKRFVSRRVFDALTQAKVEFDRGMK